MRLLTYLGTDTSLFSLLCGVLPGYISEVFYYFHFLNVVLMAWMRDPFLFHALGKAVLAPFQTLLFKVRGIS